ncbi:MAG: DUF1080 domain-containing protein [Bacteroidaceae bacterium]|nr:DUF1080 domain-containing protein [Bacteroidaceae bacterium]
MKISIYRTLALALFLLPLCGASLMAQKKGSTVTIVCSQGFQGPELWDRHEFPVDKKGYFPIFDGQSLAGWRGYGKNYVPSKWKVEDGCIHLDSKAKGEGGDIIFAHKFGPDFEFQMEWRIAEGGNSGIFYLAQEALSAEGNLEPIYISAPECQVLDNERHPDAKLGRDNNRQAGSLYDMIPAVPQNAKPAGQWNTILIRVQGGTVTHVQNGKQVLQYQLGTPEWTQMLQQSKFSEQAWPAAFRLLNNCGGPEHKGFIGVQDHGDDVWFRNIKVKLL